MAAKFFMATRASSAHSSQNVKSTHPVVIMKLPEEQTLMDALIESYYLVHIDSK